MNGRTRFEISTENQQTGIAGLHLLFADGKRPSRAAMREVIANHSSITISHDPAQNASLYLVDEDQKAQRSEIDKRAWLELLLDGLTFDLVGLSPGLPCPIPEIEHCFDFDRRRGIPGCQAIKLIPGAHLLGGAHSIPVMRAMVMIARDLCNAFEELVAVAWEPAKSVMGRRYFESVSTAWLEGGAFPALGLIACRETSDKAVESVGLSYWIGQELRIEPMLAADKVKATRLAVRLINHLIFAGRLDQSERFTASDGAPLTMRPSTNFRFIRVAPE